MADRTFESQQYASQEAARGEASLSQGIGALAGAATQAGAALERHGDRMAQREQVGAQMAESRRQADQSAGLRRDEMGLQREHMGQQGRQFDQQLDLTRARQAADLRFRQQVEGRLVQGQLAEQEISRAKVVLDWQAHTAARGEFEARFQQEERKLAILSQAKLTGVQVQAAELQIEEQKMRLAQMKAQQEGEYQRGRLSGRTLTELTKQSEALGVFLEKLTNSDSIGGGPERSELIKTIKARYDSLNAKIDAYLTESEEGSQNQTVGPPTPPRRQAAAPPPPQPVGGVRPIDYTRFDNIVERSMLGAVRSPKSSNQDNARISAMMFRVNKDGTGVELTDPVAYQKWKEAASRLFVGMPEQGHSEQTFIEAFNRQVDVLMRDYGMSLHAALDHLGGVQ